MKRKVTDLKPNEAILISNDAERDAILQLMEDAGWLWNSGDSPFYVLPIKNPYPYYLAYKFEGTDGFPNRGIRVVDYDYEGNCVFYPATDFIGSEGESVEADWKKIAEQLTTELEKVSEFFRNFDRPNDTFGTFVSKQIEFDEIAESVDKTLELTRNTPTNEQR